MKRFILLMTILSLGLTVKAQTADETAVNSLVVRFATAFNAHDTKAFAATFSEDADFTNWVGLSGPMWRLSTFGPM